jgi:NAD(P)-dependent dehydrogenase (short-subunit alcohol dehydrogenase family)
VAGFGSGEHGRGLARGIGVRVNHFRKQGGGAYIHITSGTGLAGNVGQTNYGAAKAGIVGLSKCIALDMKRYNVRSNCISRSHGDA